MDTRTTSPSGSGEEGPESSEPESSERSGSSESGSSEDKRYLRTLFAVYAALLVTAFCVAVWAQRVEGDFATAVTALGAVFLLVPTVEVVARRDARHDATQHRLTFLKALGTAAALAAVVWLVLAALPVDVTGRTELNGGAGVGAGGTAQLVVEAEPGGHDELSVTLEARDDDAGATSCLPGSELTFQGQDLAEPVTVGLDDEITTTLALDAAGPGVSVDVTLLADEGCQVTLLRKQASYR